MWQSIASFAEAELTAKTEAAQRSYERLERATLELQRNVNALLSDNPGAADEKLSPLSGTNPAGGVTNAMGHAARALSSLCMQPQQGDFTSAPGAIYTPKADARQRAPTDAVSSNLEGSDALKAFLAADVLSMRWDAASVPVPSAGAALIPLTTRLRNLEPVPTALSGPSIRRASVQNPRLPLPVRVDVAADTASDTQIAQQGDELRTWSLRALKELHTDVALEELHSTLMRNAVQYGTLPLRRGGAAAWFNIYGKHDVTARSRPLLAGLFHLSRSSEAAWAGITEAFSHSLVQPDGEAVRLLGTAGLRTESSGSRGFGVTPASCQSYIRGLQDTMNNLLGEMLQDHLEDRGCSQSCPSLSEKDVAAFRHAITPRSYLQVVGQKVLHHAALQIPCMAELPERIPAWTLRNLYGRPFAEALKLALQHGIAAVDEAFGSKGGPGSKGERVRGDKLAASPLPTRNELKRADARKQQQSSRRDASAAAGRFGSTLSGAAVGGGGGSAVPPGYEGGGRAEGDVCQHVMSRARSAVGLLADIESDIRGFEAGFAELLMPVEMPVPSASMNAGRLNGQVLQQSASSSLCCLSSEQAQMLSQKQQGQQQEKHSGLVCADAAVVYVAVVRKEVARAVRELGPMLETFLYGSVTSVLQALLAGGSGELSCQPTSAVPLTAEIWPSLEEAPLGQPPAQARRDGGGAMYPGPDQPGGSESYKYTSRIENPVASCAHATESEAVLATPATRSSHCAALQLASSREVGCSSGSSFVSDRDAPASVDSLSYRVLEFVSWLLAHQQLLPESLQPVLLSAVVEGLALLMDRLSALGTCAGPQQPLLMPLPALFLLHSSTCTLRRRLQAMQPCVMAVGCSPKGWQYGGGRQDEVELVLELVQAHGEALLQADDLMSTIQQRIVLSYMQVVYDVVLSSLDFTNWNAFRSAVARGQCAGPAIRVWHSMMLRLLRTAVAYSSPRTAEWVFGQVLLESVSTLLHRYLQLGPSLQMLREFVGDAVHLTGSLVVFCQPISISGQYHLPTSGGGGDGVGCGVNNIRGGHDASWRDAQRKDSAMDGAKTIVHRLRIPFPVAHALAAAARELLTRAALLHIDGCELAQLARKVSQLQEAHLATSDSNAAGVAAVAAAAVAAPRLAAAPQSQEDSSPSGQHTCSAAVHSSANLGPLRQTAVAPASLGLPRQSAGVRKGEAECKGVAPTALNATAEALPDRIRTLPSTAATYGKATDDERLALWASWLPADVLRALTDAAEAIDLGGGGGTAAASQVLIPLRDRMVDSGSTGVVEGQGSQEVEGTRWRACLRELAQRASPEQLVMALARRQELHPAVGTEPPGNEESRRIVRGAAVRLGLIAVDEEEGQAR